MLEPVDWGMVVLSLAGGLALFLIGMDQMTDALKALTGHRLQRILTRLSANRVSGALTGAAATAALQSSSVTTVLTVGFVAAKMLTVTQSASLIIGANLGTTVTAQIIALNVSDLALALIAVGAVLWLFVPQRTWRTSGRAIAALGFVFFGLKVMADAMLPLASSPAILDALAAASSPWLALAAGAILTAVVQSSSATTGVVIAMAAASLIDLPTGIAIILGANIGTCFTAVLAALGRGRPALRTATIHVLVNLLGAVAWLLFLPLLVDIVQFISPTDTATPRQFANAHTVFNLVNTVAFLLLLTPLVALATRLVPDKAANGVTGEELLRLDMTATGTAALGIPGAEKANAQLGEDVIEFFSKLFANAVQQPATEALTDAHIDEIKVHLRSESRSIVGYLVEVSHSAQDDTQVRRLLALVAEADELAHLADSLASSFRRINRRRRRSGAMLTTATSASLLEAASDVSGRLSEAISGATPSLLDADAHREPDSVARRLIENRDIDRYALESDLREVLERVELSISRISGVQSEETI